jgi:hypothetical protein
MLNNGSARQGALGLRSGHGWNSSIDDRSGLFSEAGIPGRDVDRIQPVKLSSDCWIGVFRRP